MKPSVIPILISGIVAGILDGAAAVVILAKMNFQGVWKLVASGYFGEQAFTGGNKMIFFGLLFHFSIAIFWAIVYYLLSRGITFFRHNVIIGGIFYGIFIWSIMNLVVVPLTSAPQAPITLEGTLINMAILICCVGLPIAIIQYKMFQKNSKHETNTP